MRDGLLALSLLGAASAFGACGLSLALFGLGLPFLAAALVAGGGVGLLLYVVGRWIAPPGETLDLPTPDEQVRLIEERSAAVRHELPGVLSPALMVSDRLLNHDDPAIRRAGAAIVRSVERAGALIAPPAG